MDKGRLRIFHWKQRTFSAEHPGAAYRMTPSRLLGPFGRTYPEKWSLCSARTQIPQSKEPAPDVPLDEE